jgi:hypothetical protein
MTDLDATDDEFGGHENGPVDFANSKIIDVDSCYGEVIYTIDCGGCTWEVNEAQFRIVDQYEAARRRQAEAFALAERRWWKPAPPPPQPEPEPEAIPPGGKLTGRQEDFCRNYVAQPVAAHAAVLAGYGEDNARAQGSRLLKNPIVLARIAALRAERGLTYALDADTLHDKLEAVFFDALSSSNHGAAVSALRLQAGLARLPMRAVERVHESTAAPRAAAEPGSARLSQTARKTDKRGGKGRKKPTKAYK